MPSDASGPARNLAGRFGMTPAPPVERRRVLELGCGDGANFREALSSE
jgi:hypothetical protein